jgi:phenylacetate-coenzyme A ligase PaaK-like adenylate-forming protein
MPWIRYEVEDQVEYKWKTSSQGARKRRLTMIHGRESDLLLLPDGSRRAYQTLTTHIKSRPDVPQYQIVQFATDVVQILLVVNPAAFDREVLILREEFSRELPASVRVEFLRVDRIEPDASGKRKLVVSEIEG